MMNYTIKQNVAVVRPNYPLSDGQDAAKLINAVRFQNKLHLHADGPQRLCAGAVHSVQRCGGAGAQALYPEQDAAGHRRVFTIVTRPPCGDFIFGCNRGDQVGFWENEQEGLAWLTRKR